jgi:hypothetical protein
MDGVLARMLRHDIDCIFVRVAFHLGLRKSPTSPLWFRIDRYVGDLGRPNSLVGDDQVLIGIASIARKEL